MGGDAAEGVGEVWRRRWGDRRNVKDLKVVGFNICLVRNFVS